jgi:putative nucleotidyltransferase-like protein
MRPELELVICATRPKTLMTDSRLRALLTQPLNWDEVLACAHRHNLGPLLQERLRSLDSTRIAPEQSERLAGLARELGRNNLADMGEMLWLYGLFETAGIRAIPFKGPAFAWLAYKNFAHRSSVDLDFVLPQHAIPQATELLQAQGYTPQFGPAEMRAGERGQAPGQYAFAPSGKRRYVELHTEKTLRYFSRPIDLNELNSRLIQMKIGGREILVFSAEDLLVMLCVHGGKHFWERISWIVDISQLVGAPPVDWELLMGIAAKLESRRALSLGLYLAHEVAGAELPEPVLARARGDANVCWLARSVIEQYEGISDPRAGIFRRAAFRLRSCDHFGRGLRQLIRLSLIPTESDREMIRLPGFLTPLYVAVRPLRLLGKYGLGRIRKPSSRGSIEETESERRAQSQQPKVRKAG